MSMIFLDLCGQTLFYEADQQRRIHRDPGTPTEKRVKHQGFLRERVVHPLEFLLLEKQVRAFLTVTKNTVISVNNSAVFSETMIQHFW